MTLLTLSAMMTAHSQTAICDMQGAREICDSRPLAAPEGIWLYPDDQVSVLISRSAPEGPNSLERYDITVVDSSDAGISPGAVIGRLESTPDSRSYRMTLFTDRKAGRLCAPKECLATLDKEGDVFLVKSKRVRIRINPFSVLPRFWRVARVSTDDPLQKLPVGMIRLYPSYDGNGSTRRMPRHL